MTVESVIFAMIAAAILTFALWMSAFLTQQAMFKVIGVFCRNKALRVQDAKTIEELELTPPDLRQRLTQMRDYKPIALNILIQQGVVNKTLDGKLYLLEGKLNPNLRCDDHSTLPQ